jgi:prepilin-type N-terminal cleavage/methylation domain-containing protein
MKDHNVGTRKFLRHGTHAEPGTNSMMGNHTDSQTQTGFTLIEMLLVLSIFGLLIGIGVPRIAGWVGWNRQLEAVEDLRSEIMKTAEVAVSAGTPIGLRLGMNGRQLEWIQGVQDDDGDWQYSVIGRAGWVWGGLRVRCGSGGVAPEEVLEREHGFLQTEWNSEDIIWWDSNGLTTGGTIEFSGRAGGVWVIEITPLVDGDMVVRYEG